MKNASPQSGFSLLELVVSVAILGIIMGSAFQLMGTSQISFDRNQVQAEAHANADFAAGRVTEIIRGAMSNPANITLVNPFLITQPDGETSIDIKSDLDGD